MWEITKGKTQAKIIGEKILQNIAVWLGTLIILWGSEYNFGVFFADESNGIWRLQRSKIAPGYEKSRTVTQVMKANTQAFIVKIIFFWRNTKQTRNFEPCQCRRQQRYFKTKARNAERRLVVVAKCRKKVGCCCIASACLFHKDVWR